MQDTYMIGNNVTFSSQWGCVGFSFIFGLGAVLILFLVLHHRRTPCTEDYGDCGCDNCKGQFEDISTRMDEFAQRMFVNGWSRTKAVWTVPQAFGQDTLVPSDLNPV